MKIIKRVPFLLLSFAFIFIFSFISLSIAEEPVFQTTKEEMIKELTREPVRYRGFAPKASKRSIVVAERENDVITEKVIIVTENEDIPKLNLKIEFDYNSSALKPGSFSLLSELGKALVSQELNNSDILVNGHTDSDGSERYNLGLSLDRAYAVQTYLVKNFDFPVYRLKITGYGESMPLKPNDTSENKQINRRVEIRVQD